MHEPEGQPVREGVGWLAQRSNAEAEQVRGVSADIDERQHDNRTPADLPTSVGSKPSTFEKRGNQSFQDGHSTWPRRPGLPSSFENGEKIKGNSFASRAELFKRSGLAQ